MLQRIEFTKVCMGKNVNKHHGRNFDIFVVKVTDLNALLSFYCHLAFQRDPKPFSQFSLFEFPVLRKWRRSQSRIECVAFTLSLIGEETQKETRH